MVNGVGWKRFVELQLSENSKDTPKIGGLAVISVFFISQAGFRLQWFPFDDFGDETTLATHDLALPVCLAVFAHAEWLLSCHTFKKSRCHVQLGWSFQFPAAPWVCFCYMNLRNLVHDFVLVEKHIHIWNGFKKSSLFRHLFHCHNLSFLQLTRVFGSFLQHVKSQSGQSDG